MTPAQTTPDPLDPAGLRGDAPLFDAYLRAISERRTPFIIPGHKGRRDLIGDLAAWDSPLYGGVDDVKQRGGYLDEAERRAARAWGADLARFSVGGSTHGNQAVALAVCGPGDRVIVPRTLHRSLLSALVLTGAEPVWVQPRIDTATGLPKGVAADQIEAAFAEAPGAVAVFTADPGYIGTMGETAAIAEVAHGRGAPLIVDAAWAGHFGFSSALPPHALALGADAMVTSVHKALPGAGQAALILARTERIDPARFAAAVESTMTTSPSGAIMASIDAARALLERDGERLGRELVALVDSARRRLSAIEGLVVLDGPDVDPAKLVLVLAGTGADGIAIERDLLDRGMALEMADRDTLIAMITHADTEAEVDALVTAVSESVQERRGTSRPVVGAASWTVDPQMVAPPREAFFAPHEVVAADRAIGRVSAELIAPYPPGVPVLAPGERITAEALDSLRAARAAGTRIAYASNPQLHSLRVLR